MNENGIEWKICLHLILSFGNSIKIFMHICVWYSKRLYTLVGFEIHLCFCQNGMPCIEISDNSKTEYTYTRSDAVVEKERKWKWVWAFRFSCDPHHKFASKKGHFMYVHTYTYIYRVVCQQRRAASTVQRTHSRPKRMAKSHSHKIKRVYSHFSPYLSLFLCVTCTSISCSLSLFLSFFRSFQCFAFNVQANLDHARDFNPDGATLWENGFEENIWKPI